MAKNPKQARNRKKIKIGMQFEQWFISKHLIFTTAKNNNSIMKFTVTLRFRRRAGVDLRTTILIS